MQAVLMRVSLPAWDDATVSGADASIPKITAGSNIAASTRLQL